MESPTGSHLTPQPLSAPSPPPPVTLIITTSPTPSAPSTDLVSAVLRMLRRHCPAVMDCPVIVVLDAYTRVGDRERLKRGQLTEDCARDYVAYKRNVKALVISEFLGVEDGAVQIRSTGGGGEGIDGSEEQVVEAEEKQEEDEEEFEGCESLGIQVTRESGRAEFGSPCLVDNSVGWNAVHLRRGTAHVTFVEPVARLGFGLGVRTALRIATTDYVWVQQHDWPLVRDIPLADLLDVMRGADNDVEAPVRYVCFPSVRMIGYATSEHVKPFIKLRTATAKWKKDYHPSSPPIPANATESEKQDLEKERQRRAIPLTPLFFWHDKPHVASRAHYLGRAFPSRLAMPRGAFIEDTIGHRARSQMKEGIFAKWACWLYYPEGGTVSCVKHLNGRKWKGIDAELAIRPFGGWKKHVLVQTADEEPENELARQ